MNWARITEAQNILGKGEPWEHGALGPMIPRIEPVKVRDHSARHCFSACLFREPTFQLRFPGRSYQERYLERCAASVEALAREGHHLNIICDQKSLKDALSIGIGSVFLCLESPSITFAKHLFRYYSVFLPCHPTIEYYHFRGMDNILKSAEEPKLIEEFEASGCDLLRSPYFPFSANQDGYIRVRGSCSVNLRAAKSLAHFLSHQPLSGLPGRMAFHCDEAHLNKWFQRDWRHLNAFTLIDRKLKAEFYADLRKMVNEGVDQTIVVRIKSNGPMSSQK
jgi:hypothetical protein